jgi:hypothetical protein
MPRLRWLLPLPLAIVAVQAIQVGHTNPPVEADLDAPAQVKAILRRACWDCHSNETEWGWHTWIAPVSWLAVSDVNHGRRELNFSTPLRRSPARTAKKIAEEVRERAMPPALYLLAHPGARLTDGDRATLVSWARSLRDARRAEQGGDRR